MATKAINPNRPAGSNLPARPKPVARAARAPAPPRLDPDQLMTLEEAAPLLGLTYAGMHKVAKRGELGRKLGRTWLVTPRELELYRQRCIRSNELRLSGPKRRVPALPIVTDLEVAA